MAGKHARPQRLSKGHKLGTSMPQKGRRLAFEPDKLEDAELWTCPGRRCWEVLRECIGTEESSDDGKSDATFSQLIRSRTRAFRGCRFHTASPFPGGTPRQKEVYARLTLQEMW